MEFEEEIENLGEKIDKKELVGRIKQEYPRLVEKPFVEKKKGLMKKIFGWAGYGKKNSDIMINPNLKSPFLFLMKDDGYTDIIEGIRPGGVFILKDKNTKREKGILLQQSKLTTLNIEPYPKCIIAYENEMTPYPMDIKLDSAELIQIVRKIETTNKLLDQEAKLINAKMMFWLAIIGGIALFLYFASQSGWLAGIF